MRSLLIAVGFLTRIPVPTRVYGDSRAEARSLAWYPLVGAVLGALLAALSWGLRDATPWIRAALVLTAWVALTGALHLDGLADSADAWVGGIGNRERTLAIMKDPRTGPMGVVTVVLLLLLKFAALASLSPARWAALLFAPTLARAALVALFLTTPYVRAAGLGTHLATAPRLPCVLSLAACIILCVGIPSVGLVALIAAVAVFVGCRRASVRRIGGFTGDTAGALAELTEVAVLVVTTVF